MVSVFGTSRSIAGTVRCILRAMKFAKIVFWIAGVYGVLILVPLYFLFDFIGRETPPPITHPEFYYGFLGVTLVWQLVYMLIATNPVRYRLVMLLAATAKGSYATTLLVLCLQNRVTVSQAASGLPDTILAILFLIAYTRTSRTGYM